MPSELRQATIKAAEREVKQLRAQLLPLQEQLEEAEGILKSLRGNGSNGAGTRRRGKAKTSAKRSAKRSAKPAARRGRPARGQEAVLTDLKANPGSTAADVAKRLGFSANNAGIHLKKLKDSGAISDDGAKRGKKYSLK